MDDWDYDFEGNDTYEFGAYDFDDLFGGVDELMNFDINNLDLSGFDIGLADEIYGGANFDINDFADIPLPDFSGVDEYMDFTGPGSFVEDVEEQAGGFYGNRPGTAVYNPATDTTELYDINTDTVQNIFHGDTEAAEEALGDQFWQNTIGAGQEDYEEKLSEDFWNKLGTEDEGAGTIEVVGKNETEEALADQYWNDLMNSVVITGKKDLDPFEVDQMTSRDETDALKTGDDTGMQDVVITGQKPTSILTDDEHTRTFDDDGAGTIEIVGKKETQDPYEVDQQTSRDETDALKTVADTLLTDEEHTRVFDKKEDTKITDAVKKLADTLTKKDNAALLALLGGLMGLLSKGSSAPAGYQYGKLPKLKAVRGPARSPTEGGRRPGAAGIGSLTGGVSYVPAAQGGLMGLASGGRVRPARYLAGGTDGMADKIKTSIDGKQAARLSHGEFVIPADVVSHLGNGNSDAGADVLYDMMSKVRKARTGNPKQGKQINPRKYTPV